MRYAVELLFEDSAAGALGKLFELTDSLMSRIEASPHVSLAMFDNVDTSRLINVVRSLRLLKRSISDCPLLEFFSVRKTSFF